jgi:hypothetical protein
MTASEDFRKELNDDKNQLFPGSTNGETDEGDSS